MPPRYIINFPTKRHWRGKSRIEDIESGLESLAREIRSRRIRSIAIPPLGSGLGGLHWPSVRMRMEAALGTLEDVELEAHKLMYFMQTAGEPLRLNFTKGRYGPYAENFRHVLHAINGHFVSGYADGGDAPGKQLHLVPGASEDARAFLDDEADTRARFARVADLVDGSPRTMKTCGAGGPKRCVAIVGAGVSVLGAAWALNHHPDRFDFRLCEAQGHIGGNTITVEMPQDYGGSILRTGPSVIPVQARKR